MTSFNRTYASTLQATHRQVWLSLLWCHCSFFLGPGTHKVVVLCVCPQESVSLVLWKFCNQIPLAFKVKFPGNSQSFSWIPRLGNLLWALEFSQPCENFFGIIVLQSVGPLLSGSMAELMATSLKRAYAAGSASRSAAARAPVPMAGHCWLVPLQGTNTQRQVWLSP